MKSGAGLSAVLVGCGGFSGNYLPVYAKLPGVKVLACVDSNLEAARSMARTLGIEHASTDIGEAIAIEADYAVVSTPNYLHVEQAAALLRSGKHVLLQKPMARNVGEARELCELARSRPGQRLGLFMSMLDFGMWWGLRAAIAEQNCLGSITQVSMRLGHIGGLAWNRQPGELWRFSRQKTGGGAFIMLGVHYLHFLRWLLGLQITRVSAHLANLHCSRVEGEDICQVQGQLDNGGFVQLSVAWNSQGEHFAAYGTEGSVVYLDNELLRVHGVRPWRTPYFKYETAGRWQTFPGIVPPRLDDADNPHNQHRQFAEALKAGRPPVVDAREGLRDLQATDAVYRSAASGNWEAVADA